MPLLTQAKESLAAILSLYASLFCVVVAPLLVGTNRPYPVTALGLVAFVAFAAHLADLRQQKRQFSLPVLALPFLLGAIFTLSMLIVLPTGLRAILAPEATRLFQIAAGLIDLSSWQPLSLDPTATAMRFIQLISAFFVFIVLSSQAKNTETQKIIFNVVLFGAFLLVATAFGHRIANAETIWGIYNKSGSYLFAPMINPNNLSRVFGLFCFLCVAGLFSTTNRLRQYWFATGAIMCGASTMLALSRGGMLSFVIGMSVLAAYVLSQRENSSRLIPLCIVAVALGIGCYLGLDLILGEMGATFKDNALEDKTIIYGPFFNVMTTFGLVGTGPGALAPAFHHAILPQLGLSSVLLGAYRVPYFENILMQTLSDHGWIKGAVLISVFAYCTFVMLRESTNTPKRFVLLVACGFWLLGDFVDFSIEAGAVLFLLACVLAVWTAEAQKAKRWKIPKLVTRLSFSGSIFFLAGTSWVTLAYSATKYDNNVAVLKAAFRHHATNDQYAFLVGEALLRDKKFSEALKWYYLSVQIRPTKAKAHFRIADLWGHAGQLDKSIFHYRAAITSNSDLAEQIVEHAAKYIKSPVRLEHILPAQTPNFLIHLCNRWHTDGDWAQASKCYFKVATHPGVREEQIIRAANFFAQTNYPNKSLEIIKKYLSGKLPDGNLAVATANAVSKAQGDSTSFAASELWLMKAKEPCPLLQWRINTAVGLHDFRSAQSALSILETCPGDLISQVEIDRIQARILEAENEPSRALQIVQRLAQTDSDNVDLLVWLARLQLHLNLIENVTQTIGQIAAIDPKNGSLEGFRASLAKKSEQLVSDQIHRMIKK